MSERSAGSSPVAAAGSRVDGTRPATEASPGRPLLDRERVLRAAVELIDEHGIGDLTMRRLGAHLGVEAMTLYRYVPGRESLLDGVVETVLEELSGDPDVLVDATSGWQDYLQRLAHGVRRIALAHPEVFPLIATRPPSAPWIRPPLRSLTWLESFVRALTGDGFPDEVAVVAYRAYTSFLLGHLLLEVAQRGVAVSPADSPEGEGPADGLGRYPTLARLRPLLSQDETAAEFELSLENLLERLDRLLAASRRRSGG